MNLGFAWKCKTTARAFLQTSNSAFLRRSIVCAVRVNPSKEPDSGWRLLSGWWNFTADSWACEAKWAKEVASIFAYLGPRRSRVPRHRLTALHAIPIKRREFW